MLLYHNRPIVDYEYQIFSVNSAWRPTSLGVRIVYKPTGHKISVVECRTQEENKELANLLMFLWEKFGIKIDKKDAMGYNYYGVEYGRE